ncbi:DNA topoisomerase III [Clostridium tyrobutyricum]|jgi:DNA topoisomerase-3|uniref:DNA topoisomerase 3 n=2 Tax=Clostridium tyrobutyricum TaxID=1519 RepID=W6N3C4_CLOTY|nr:DNA topoisomerase III [Clostridium tyrobutyricum]AND84910.1 DNA topoisomerase III [Clostridium tyrobutyricum]ANP69483.1 DNA topoisomerase III [Clostridium tyrobutyricum]MBV4416590.1 DNA topoisomerase III [Clostridium tyrobutyricum]MBV4435350.1 DNA topoisomerase III [Clostridium tyrobutyricum]MBV4439965.1 DNA topoisomerase III [Clostridium tyrobutyricum]
MSKILVLAEKPSVGKDLAKVLHCNRKNGGYIEGDKYVVTWALGHLVTLADPEVYDQKYKSWNMEDLPMLPKYLKLVVIKQTGKQFNIVKSQMNRKDISEIVIATDAGREGELVARWIIEKAHIKKTLKRLWISSQTQKAINDGFRNLKSSSKYDYLYDAAKCRAEADWIIGLNVTRALTCKYNAQLTAGRVQSPTLAMIVNREEEINNFKPKDYYNVEAKTKYFNLKWTDSKGNSNIFEGEKANNLANHLKNQKCTIIEVNTHCKKQFPQKLYDLTELQRDGNKLFGYSAKQTLSIMQRLYENYKILTYPRTDSRYISTDIVGTLKDRLKSICLSQYGIFINEILKNGINANKNFVDNSKIGDHHAIIPTEESIPISRLSLEERNIYDLVVKRFISVMLPPYEYIETSIKANIGKEIFSWKGNAPKNLGWKKIYVNNKQNVEDHSSVPKRGDSIDVISIELEKLQTKAPPRFNEASLLSAMENPQKYVKMDKKYADTLGETGGIGTVATRADIIDKLFNMFYLEKRGKEIIPTSKGKQLINLVPRGLKSPLLTAKWEKTLDEISKGKKDPKVFLRDMREYAVELVNNVSSSNSKFKYDNLSGEKCPNCGKYMLEVKGKRGRMLVCQDRNCGYRENIAVFTNARCPECHKKMELRGHGDGKIYVCSNCGFREKLASFKKRFNKSESKLNKREISKYMNKMHNENKEPINSALADALSKFKNQNK